PAQGRPREIWSRLRTSAETACDRMTTDKVLKFGIPKGSLEAQTLELLRKSGWRISVSERSYLPRSDDPELSCRLLRPQEMPRYIEDGTIDAGITGSDWIVENGADLAPGEGFT